MSTSATLFTIYFMIGVLFMAVAVASPGKEKRTKGFETADGGDGLDAALLIFIALLWQFGLSHAFSRKTRRIDFEFLRAKKTPNKSPEPTLTVRPFSFMTTALETPSSLRVSVAHL